MVLRDDVEGEEAKREILEDVEVENKEELQGEYEDISVRDEGKEDEC